MEKMSWSCSKLPSKLVVKQIGYLLPPTAKLSSLVAHKGVKHTAAVFLSALSEVKQKALSELVDTEVSCARIADACTVGSMPCEDHCPDSISHSATGLKYSFLTWDGK